MKWRDINGYENLYEASEVGYVRNKKTGKILKPVLQHNGYLHVTLYKNKKPKQFRHHRIIAETFISNPENKPHINHLDEDKANNKVSNLQWCTSKENNNYGNHIKNVVSSRQVKIVDNYGVIYNGVNEAGEKLGICPQNISKVLVGKRKTAGGLSFNYYNGDDKY